MFPREVTSAVQQSMVTESLTIFLERVHQHRVWHGSWIGLNLLKNESFERFSG